MKMTLFIEINGVQPGKPVNLEVDQGSLTLNHLYKAVERAFDVPRAAQQYLIKGQFITRNKYKLLEDLGLQDQSHLILLGQRRNRQEHDHYSSDDDSNRDLLLFDKRLGEYWHEMRMVDKFDDGIITLGKMVAEVKEAMMKFKTKATPLKADDLQDFIETQKQQVHFIVQQANLKKEQAKKLNLSPKVESERPLLIQSIELIIDRCNELKQVLNDVIASETQT